MPKRTKNAQTLDVPTTSPYSSKIIKVGAVLADTKMLLAQWDLSASPQANMDRAQRDNLFGKASRSRVGNLLASFRQRFLAEPSVIRGLTVLVQARFPSNSLDRILFYHTALADRLLYDVVTEVLTPILASGITSIEVPDIQRPLQKWVAQDKTVGSWSGPTMERIAQGILSTLRDFGLLQGAAHKRIAPVYMPITAFAYIAFYLKQHQPSGAKLLDHPDWKLFFMNRNLVERFLLEANQHRLLEYHAAGSVTRLTFPKDTLEEYANVLAQKSR